MTHVGLLRNTIELHLQRNHPLVATLDDEVDLVVPISGAQVVNGGLMAPEGARRV